MTQTIVLDPPTDTSSEVSIKKPYTSVNKQSLFSTSAVDTQNDRAVGLLKGQSTGTSGTKANLTVSNDSLLTGIENMLAEQFLILTFSDQAAKDLASDAVAPKLKNPLVYGDARIDDERLSRFLRRNSPGSTLDLWLRANGFIAVLRRLVLKRNMIWYEPAVSYDPHDDVVEISWSRPDKALIVTVEQDLPITFLKVWGPSIYNDMLEATSPPVDELIGMWQWLYM